MNTGETAPPRRAFTTPSNPEPWHLSPEALEQAKAERRLRQAIKAERAARAERIERAAAAGVSRLRLWLRQWADQAVLRRMRQ